MAPVLGDGGMGDLRTGQCYCQARGKSFLDVSKRQRCWIYIPGSTGNKPALRSRPYSSTDMAVFSGPSDVNVTEGANKYSYSSFRASHVIGYVVAKCRTGRAWGGL